MTFKQYMEKQGAVNGRRRLKLKDAAAKLGISIPHVHGLIGGKPPSITLALAIIKWSNNEITLADLAPEKGDKKPC